MANSDLYWKDRTEAAQKRMDSLVDKGASQQRRRILNVLKKITKLMKDYVENPPKYEWQLERQKALRDSTRELLKGLATEEVEITAATLDKVFDDAFAQFSHGLEKVEGLETFTTNSEELKRVALRASFHGSDYSSRIWKNTERLASKLDGYIDDLVLRGIDPTKDVMRELGASYSVARRLITTEAARVFSEAALDTYKAHNVKEVAVLVEAGACDECEQMRGQHYPTYGTPTIPIHPFAAAA